ncbi:M23 family metallopeptidase [Enterovirga sp. DB1703]|uniref:M23 family metallopeptidase n=1 Tax=Enterovirga aerilata TaxID=2730920 RepID=A0A849IA36_9HYPH|nr:M23 family metallopeptidase [Enterovirga sp. DB1703]
MQKAPPAPSLLPRRRRDVRRTALASFGNEPPLDPAVPAAASGGRHAVSFRWLGACVLIGLMGGLLLGSAIYVSSEGETTFADLPQRAPTLASRGDGAGAARKADKLVRTEMVASAKQSFRTPMTLRAGDREVIKVRNFVRIATNLSLTSGVYASDIPPFNPLRFFADTPGERGFEPPPETSDAEVSVVKSELSTLAVEFGQHGLSDEQVVLQLEDEARLRAEAGRRANAPLPSTAMLSRMLGRMPAAAAVPVLPGGDAALQAPFRSIEVRVVPENVTEAPKSGPKSAEVDFEERVVPIRRGETLESVLRANGASPDDVRAILATLVGRDRQLGPVDGMQLRLLLAPPPRPGEARRLVRAILFGERGIEAISAMNDRGAFVSVTPPQTQSAARAQGRAGGEEEEEDEQEGSGVTLYNSLYETALKQELPRQTVEELVRIFGYDVDFQRRVAPGDSFEIFYATDDEGGDRLEILSATITLGNDTHRVYRYQGEDGSVDYFDDAGRSLKKFLIRKPVVEARLSSGFGTRYHPILGYAKMHTGVDWAARVGTPIFAAGNGTVIKAAWDSGYGRRTEIQHANGYVTAYNHQSSFARGIAPGARVRQGQVIGYVGSTGLSTGAHLHYEVIVNGHFVDPMKIRVPRGRELDGRALVEFGRQRDQIDQLMQKASPNRLAQRG